MPGNADEGEGVDADEIPPIFGLLVTGTIVIAFAVPSIGGDIEWQLRAGIIAITAIFGLFLLYKLRRIIGYHGWGTGIKWLLIPPKKRDGRKYAVPKDWSSRKQRKKSQSSNSGSDMSFSSDFSITEYPPIAFVSVAFAFGGAFLYNTVGGVSNNRSLLLIPLGAAIVCLYFGYRIYEIRERASMSQAMKWAFAPIEEDVEIQPKVSEKDYGSLEDFRSMDEYEFEYVVGDLLETMGWDAEVTDASQDHGIDIIATKEDPIPQKCLVQAKRYAKGNTVGSPQVQQYYSLKDQEDNVDQVWIVTTSSFTSQAEDLADDLNVKLIDGADFIDLYNKYME